MTRTAKQIAIAVVEDESGQVLIGLRPDGAPLAGYWEFPGGKVHAEETFEAAAVRECLEETGLEVEIAGEFPPAEFDYEHAAVQLRFFRCHLIDQTATPRNGFRWVMKSELGQYKFPEANGALIRLLQSQPEA